jgi:hypothetical protein
MKQNKFHFAGNLQALPNIGEWVKGIYLDQPVNAKGERQDLIITCQSPKQWKTNEQNRFFHALLTLYWESGQSSYDSPASMRTHFKEIAGCIDKEVKKITTELDLTLEAKKGLFIAIETWAKAVRLSERSKAKIYNALRGESRVETIKESSWADASKKGATLAIDCLINEMIEAGVNSQKFDEMIKQKDDYYGL